MVSAKKIMSLLSPSDGLDTIIVKKQNIKDIKKQLSAIHARYQSDYDNIYFYFIGKTPYDTCRNIWLFMRENIYNETEDKEWQTTRSPYVLLETGRTMGADCKNYALFAGGILDAINRSGEQSIPFAYRFATYKNFDVVEMKWTVCNHVFIVAFPGTSKEIWIDAIDDVPYFDYRRKPNSFTDKKINTMALVHMSGYGRPDDPSIMGVGLIKERYKVLKSGKLTRDLDREYKDAMAAMGIMGWDDAALAILPVVFNLFSSKPNANDWQGWTFGDAKHWTVNDGDSPKNEALNIISYIGAHGLDGMLTEGYGQRAVTLQEIAHKLSANGYVAEANKILSLVPGGQVINTTNPLGTNTPAKEGMSMTTILLIGGGGLLAAKALKLF